MNSVDLRDLHFNYFKKKEVPHMLPLLENLNSSETVTIFKHASCGATECIEDRFNRIEPVKPQFVIICADIQRNGLTEMLMTIDTDYMHHDFPVPGPKKEGDKLTLLVSGNGSVLFDPINNIITKGLENNVIEFSESIFIEPKSNICLLDRGCKSDFNVKSNKPKWLR